MKGRRGTVVTGTIACVILLAIAVWRMEREQESALETIHPGAFPTGRATSTSARRGAPAAGHATTSASGISSDRRPPSTPQPPSTSVAGGEVPFDSAPDDGSGDICEQDIEAVFELCDPAFAKSDCADVPAEEGAACQAGCVMQTCPKLRDCAKPDPPWCGFSCEDARGGLFWRNFWGAYYACKWQFGDEQPGLGDCTTSNVEERCPELAGTGWEARFRGLYK